MVRILNSGAAYGCDWNGFREAFNPLVGGSSPPGGTCF